MKRRTRIVAMILVGVIIKACAEAKPKIKEGL